MLRSTTRLAALLAFAVFLLQPMTVSGQQNGDGEDVERLLRRNWSLFLEYFKTADYNMARRAGWEVFRLDPSRFGTLHSRLADMYDTLATYAEEDELRRAYADTILWVLDHAVETFPDRKAEFNSLKGYHLERWYTDREDEAIKAYELAIRGESGDDDLERGETAHDADLASYFNADMYYLERLGMLYSDKPEFSRKAIDIWQVVIERDPNNLTAQAMLKRLISDPEEYIGFLRDAHYADPSNRQKLYELANGFYELVQDFDSAAVYFSKLTTLDGSVRNYWERLGASYLYLSKYKEATEAYKKLTEIDPTSKEAWINLARSILQEGRFAEARTFAERAAELDPEWGAPRMVVAQAYEAAVQRCVERTRGGWDKMRVLDKLVYLLAREEYSRAARDPQFADQARARSIALDSVLPTSEDLFVNKIPRGQSYLINRDCYTWINRSVTP